MNRIETSDAHRRSWMNLPWYLNDSLDPGEKEEIAAHVADCGACQEELKLLATLRREIREADALERMAEQNVARLRAAADARAPTTRRRLAAVVAAIRSWGQVAGTGIRRVGTVPALVISGQLVAILALAVVLVRTPGIAPDLGRYETLSIGNAPQEPGSDRARNGMAGPLRQSRLRIRFDPSTPEHQLRSLLTAAGLRIVAGPTPTGVYTAVCEPAFGVASPACDLHQLAAGLEREDAVEIALVVEDKAP